jgi:hypothetical protein
MLAHAIGDDPALFRGRSNHQSARAHTKAVHTAAIFSVVNELIFRRTEEWMTSVLPPASLIDQHLGMLNAKTNRKRLGFKSDSSLLKHLEAISR